MVADGSSSQNSHRTLDNLFNCKLMIVYV